MRSWRRERLSIAAGQAAQFWRGSLRIFWKELMELYEKPLAPLALIALSVFIVWTSGQINIKQPKITIFLYTAAAKPDDLQKARDILNEFARTSVIEIAGDLVDVNAMQGSGAILAIVYRNTSWLVLHRFATARQETEAAQLAGMIAYALRAERPLSTLLVEPGPSTIKIQLYTKGVDEAALTRVRGVLQSIPTVQYVEVNEENIDTEAMEKAGVNLALARSAMDWFFLQRFTSAVQAASAGPTIALLGYLLKPDSDAQYQPEWRRLIVPAQQGSTSRLSALPGAPQLELVPRTTALMIVFLPFVLAARSFARELAFGTLPFLLGLPHGGWRSMAAGKIAACAWTVIALLLILFLAAFPLFGFTPKPGLFLQLAVQSFAILTSACLGLLAAIQVRNQMHIYLVIAVYFLALVLVSGFLFPLETAAPLIQAASYFSPLTFSGKILESWLFFGTSPLVFTTDLLFLIAQATAAIVLLSLAIVQARKRI
jgi:ABC-type multidrug transport system permease subunit